MAQKLLISIDIGSSSAAAAMMLSGSEAEPTLVTWPPYQKPMVPFRVSYEENGEGFKWGEKVDISAESDSLFGMYPPDLQDVGSPLRPTGQVLDELYRKRGRHSYHLRWSLGHDLRSCSAKSLTLFLYAMKAHILEALRKTYSSVSSTMEKLICVVVPPYFKKSHEDHLKNFFLKEFGPASSRVHSIIQPRAALAFCPTEELIKMKPGDFVTVCHMEEEITKDILLMRLETISQFIVKQTSPNIQLEHLHSSIIVIGSFDIAERFQRYLEQRFERAIFSTEGESGEKISNEIIKQKKKFLDGLPKRYVQNSEVFKFHCKIADDPIAGIRGSRLTIKKDDMRERVFDPVLAAIFDKLDYGFNPAKVKRYVIFSGVLDECPYVHSYMKERFDTAHNIEILGTNDESTSSCRGAIFLLSKQRDVVIQPEFREQAVTVCTTPESRLQHIRVIEAELDKQRTTGRQSENYMLLRKYEVILAERISRQGYDNPDTKATVLSIEVIRQNIGPSNQVVKQCETFVDGYTYEIKRKLDPTDIKQQFSAIHLAAASNDHLALRIILAAGYSVHDLVETRPLGHFNHTPLHIYAWYNNSPNECLELLTKAGAAALPVAGNLDGSPAYIAASKGHHQLLKAFERLDTKRFLEEYPGLLLSAMAERQRETVKYLIEIGAPFSRESELKFSVLTKNWSIILPPLCTALGHAWADVAAIIINKSLASSYNNGSNVPLLRSTAAGPEAMIRLLVMWADIDTDGKDELGQTQLSWAARLGYEAAVKLLVDWEHVNADSRDKSGRSPLSWAASNGHLSIAKILAQQEGVEVDSRDKDHQTPLWWAASSGHKAMVRQLIDQGADVGSRNIDGTTALNQAAGNGHEAVVRLLLEKGADPASSGLENRTALHMAADQGHKTVVQLILEKGADIASMDRYEMTALHLAAGRGHEAVVQLLLEKGVDIASRGRQGWTALHLAALTGRKATVQLLLEKGADISSRDDNGYTALHVAAFWGYEAVVEMLLEKGADIASRDQEGWTALDIATSNGHKAVQVLLEKRANIAAKDTAQQPVLEQVGQSEISAIFKQFISRARRAKIDR